MRRLPILLPTLALLAVVGSASGAITLSSSNGTWSEWQPQGLTPDPILETSGSENRIRWGVPMTMANYGQTFLGFRGESGVAITGGSPFLVGTLRHYNTPINTGTGVTSVDLDLAMDFGSGPVLTSMTLDMTETVGDYGNGADTVTLPTAFSAQSFQVNGTTYQLQLLGFRDGSGDSVSSLVTPEPRFCQSDNQRCAGLWAEVSETTTPIPAPGALLLAGLGAVAVSLLRQRRTL